MSNHDQIWGQGEQLPERNQNQTFHKECLLRIIHFEKIRKIQPKVISARISRENSPNIRENKKESSPKTSITNNLPVINQNNQVSSNTSTINVYPVNKAQRKHKNLINLMYNNSQENIFSNNNTDRISFYQIDKSIYHINHKKNEQSKKDLNNDLNNYTIQYKNQEQKERDKIVNLMKKLNKNYEKKDFYQNNIVSKKKKENI